MAAVTNYRIAKSLNTRLDALGCPYTEGADESWITELVFKPGEPRIRLLQWLLSKYDLLLGEMVENCQSAIIVDSRMDSRIQTPVGNTQVGTFFVISKELIGLLFVFSNLGFCKDDDVDLIKGVESSAPNIINRQIAFMDQLLDIVLIHDSAEDPMTKSLLSPGLISESSPLEEQVAADCRYMNAVASLQLPNTILTPTVDLIPHDIRRLMTQHNKESPAEVPATQRLRELCRNTEENLIRRMEVLNEWQEVKTEQSASQLQRASQSLELILGEVSQLVLSFTYCFENEMLPWCNKTPPHFSQLGPAFKRVHTLLQHFVEMLQSLCQIRQSCQNLNEGVSQKLKVTDSSYASVLVKVGHEAVSSFQDCVDILETSVQQEASSLLSTSLCSSTLRL